MPTNLESPREGSGLAVGLQLLVSVGGLLAVALAPPAEGPMLLVPLTAAAAAHLPALALRDGTVLLGTGRLPGSLVIRGRRSAIAWPMLAHGVLPLASERAGCTGIAA